MEITLQIMFLAALVKLLLTTERPGLCSAIHALGHAVMKLVWAAAYGVVDIWPGVDPGFPWLAFLAGVAIWSIWGCVFFYALDFFETFSNLWIVSLAVCLFLRFGLVWL